MPNPSLPARALLGAIRLYQATLSPVLPALLGPSCGCRFAPTCSHYAAEAVRWQVAIQRYIKDQGYPLGTLAAFSGEVNDKDLGEVSETSHELNPGLNGRDIRDAFKGEAFHLLLVANNQQSILSPLNCPSYWVSIPVS